MTLPQSNSRAKPHTARGPASGRDQRKLPKPKAAIFDIGNVIVRLNLSRAFQPLAAAMTCTSGSGPLASPHEIWTAIRADPRWLDWQEGRLPPPEWHRHLMLRLKLSLGYDEFQEAWNRVLDPELILGDELFTRLAQSCRLALLSNTDPVHVQALDRFFTFTRLFPVRIYSCAIGASKPSPAIYRAALKSLGSEASETLYVDDLQEFVEAATQIGLDAVRFESRDQLERELQYRGLL